MIEHTKLRSLKDIGRLAGKVVLLRADFNVALKNGKVSEPERILRTLPTIDFLISKKAKVVIISHLGRPDGTPDKSFSLKPVAAYLQKKYPSLSFFHDCIGDGVKKEIKSMKSGDILLLENIRFYPGEEANAISFASLVATYADYYVNDAFAVSHRPHASVFAITKLLPSYAGFNLLSEVENINRVLGKIKRPGIAIVGGAKISGKIEILKKFATKFDHVLIGGALANNFFSALNYNVGGSLVETKGVALAKQLIKKHPGRLILPVDLVVANRDTGAHRIVTVQELKSLSSRESIVDIGPHTITLFNAFILLAQTLVWNGPLGKFEEKPFDSGTIAIAKFFARRAGGKPFGLVGGGETIAAIAQAKIQKQIDFISTGGGAMLEYIEKGTLPGLKVLLK